MYYKGHFIKLAISKYEDTGFARVLAVNEEGILIEEISINPINSITDKDSVNNENSPKFLILNEIILGQPAENYYFDKFSELGYYERQEFYNEGNLTNVLKVSI